MQVLHPTTRRATLLVGVFVCLAVAAHARSRESAQPNGVCSDPQHMAEARQVGRLMLQQVFSVGMPWADKALNEYVNRLGQNLARSSESQQVFSFYILYNPEVNAQAFPGGFVVVNSGVISTAENEAELASVLSHEIGHINACNCQASPRKDGLVELLTVLPVIALGGPAGIVLLTGSGLAAPVIQARINRSAEYQADRLGVQYLLRAGYDPKAALKMFERVEEEESSRGVKSGGLLAGHPALSDRRKRLEKILAGLPPPDIVPHDETEFRQMRKQVQDYDQVYSRLVGVRVPGHEASPAVLSRRPQEKTSN